MPIRVENKEARLTNRVVGVYDRTKDATGKELYVLPKGAVVLRHYTVVATAFNGTGPAVLVGVTGDTDALAAAADSAAATAGVKSSPAATLNAGVFKGPLTEDKTVIATVTEPGDGTAGVFLSICEFVVLFDDERP